MKLTSWCTFAYTHTIKYTRSTLSILYTLSHFLVLLHCPHSENSLCTLSLTLILTLSYTSRLLPLPSVGTHSQKYILSTLSSTFATLTLYTPTFSFTLALLHLPSPPLPTRTPSRRVSVVFCTHSHLHLLSSPLLPFPTHSYPPPSRRVGVVFCRGEHRLLALNATHVWRSREVSGTKRLPR